MTTIEPEVMPPEKHAVAIRPGDVNAEALIASAIEKGVSVEVLERLLTIRRELKQEAAKEAFDRGLAAFQSECPTIQKNKKVFVKGSLRYCYAPLEEIIGQVRDLLRRHGFSYSLDSQVEPGWVTALCKLTHSLGHSEVSTFKVPIDKDAFMGEAQKFASAMTFTKRYAFVNALGILTGDEDDDANGSQDGGTAGSPRQHAPTPTKGHRQQSGVERSQTTNRPTDTTMPDDGDNLNFEAAVKTPPAKPQERPVASKEGTEEQKAKMIGIFSNEKDGVWKAEAYFIAIGALKEGTDAPISALPLRFVPRLPSQMRELGERIAAYHVTGKAEKCIYMAVDDPTPKAPVTPAAAGPAKRVPKDDEAWRDAIIPIPRRGMKRDSYMQNPDTIGSLYEARHGTDDLAQEARQRLFGFLNSYEPKGWQKRDGTQMPPSQSDIDFRRSLDDFGIWFEKNHPGEKI